MYVDGGDCQRKCILLSKLNELKADEDALRHSFIERFNPIL